MAMPKAKHERRVCKQTAVIRDVAAARAPFRSTASSLTCADAAAHQRIGGGGRKECIIPIQLGRSPVYTRH
ncbi:hypothetical protein CDAR_464331 [Caerostris darwini]|uniref:Uncharacterized protein n=1 Tax=Caerostris darwini TaxID=1538125 RepID=A0AAV4VU17_9ARAC|nr:hypothetical protein CDAR_464331 [Caerostris darwini]